MIHKFQDFLNEISGAELRQIQTQAQDLFTIAFEIEMETRSTADIPWENYDLDEIEDYIAEDYFLEADEATLSFLRTTIEQIRNSSPAEILQILQADYKNKGKRDVINNLWAYLMDSNQDSKYLKKKVQEHLPHFYAKYHRFLVFETDSTLNRGLEIHPKTYFKGLKPAVDFLHDFYKEFNQQSYFEFNRRTSIHINIGLQEKTKLNLIKGIVFLADMKKDNLEVPYVFQDMVERLNNSFCGSIKEALKPVLRDILQDKPEPWNLPQLEEIINQELISLFGTSKEGAVLPYNSKNVGLNLAKLIEHNYVEFRYVGGVVNEKTVLSKLFYFCWIVYVMSNDYHRKDYFKKFYKFLQEI